MNDVYNCVQPQDGLIRAETCSYERVLVIKSCFFTAVCWYVRFLDGLLVICNKGQSTLYHRQYGKHYRTSELSVNEAPRSLTENEV